MSNTATIGKFDSVETKSLTVVGEGGSLSITGSGSTFGIFIESANKEHRLSLYVDPSQGSVVGLYDKTTAPGCDLAISVRNNDPSLQFCKDDKVQVVDVAGLMARIEKLEAALAAK